MSLVSIAVWFVGCVAVGAVVGWALKGLVAPSPRAWNEMVARDETDPEQVDPYDWSTTNGS
jgi:hypothetical protein